MVLKPRLHGPTFAAGAGRASWYWGQSSGLHCHTCFQTRQMLPLLCQGETMRRCGLDDGLTWEPLLSRDFAWCFMQDFLHLHNWVWCQCRQGDQLVPAPAEGASHM